MNKKILSHLKNATSKDWQDWRWQFKNRITNAEGLAGLLDISDSQADGIKKVASVYPLAITPYYLSLISTDDKSDPIRTQCVPDPQELCFPQYSQDDPLEEDAAMPVPKLVQRYPNRCLIITTEVCATYCRHCNRKRFWRTPLKSDFKSQFTKMIDYVAATPEIREVILSGGDPLILTDQKLEWLLASFKAIPHVEVLRIGSRIPVVMPMRITKELCRILKRYRPLWFNTQFNHPREITAESTRACNLLQEAGIPVSNQSVLLQGVNDSAEIMRNLLYSLQKISVRPYYLFHCEPVKGCGHFRTDIQSGLQLMENLWPECSGLSLPQYVIDLPGSTGKMPLTVLSQKLKNDLQKHQYFFDKFR
jgi:lysine 2,3-aminomutase